MKESSAFAVHPKALLSASCSRPGLKIRLALSAQEASICSCVAVVLANRRADAGVADDGVLVTIPVPVPDGRVMFPVADTESDKTQVDGIRGSV